MCESGIEDSEGATSWVKGRIESWEGECLGKVEEWKLDRERQWWRHT